MEPSIYSYSLCIALPLMLFFGFYFLLAPTSEKAIFNNYLRSRRIMGVAILLLAANYSVHFFFGIRFKNTDAAILMNLSTYFLCYWLFSSALTTLLDRFYITKRRLRMDTVFHPFRHRSAVVTKRWFTDNGDVCLGRMVGYLWAVLDP